MFTPLITHDSDGTALAAPVNTARCNGATYKTRTIGDLRIKDDRLRAAIEGTGHLLFDGGMGTMLQAAGMKTGALPELLNFEEPQVITDIQRQYVEAGCDVITANTFGANAHKLDGAATVADVFAAAVACARAAGAHYVAGDIGPIGALLRPLGTLSFDEAYDLFAEEVRAGVAAGVDLFIIETMTDLAEIKAAVLACRENSDLPVFATMTFEEDGRTFLGTSPEVAAVTLDAIGADVLGINCSQGPAELRGLAARMLTVTDKPVMVQANAGLPHVDDDGNTVYDYDAAKKKADEEGRSIDIHDYSYHGRKPQTKEAAILMMADTVEAATRTLKERTRENMTQMIRKLVRDKFDSGELNESPITFRELNEISDAFVRTLMGIYHERIEYPNLDALKKESAAAELPAKTETPQK